MDKYGLGLLRESFENRFGVIQLGETGEKGVLGLSGQVKAN